MGPPHRNVLDTGQLLLSLNNSSGHPRVAYITPPFSPSASKVPFTHKNRQRPINVGALSRYNISFTHKIGYDEKKRANLVVARYCS